MPNKAHSNGQPPRQPAPRSQLPPQPPVGEEDEAQVRKPSLAGRIVKRIAFLLLLVIALVFAYLFLLLGEPDEDAKYAQKPVEETLSMPMSALDMPGETDVQKLADSFGEPVLMLNQLLPMYKSRIFDTALDGGYARCVTITYTLEDGSQLLVESMRPTAAVSLLKQEGDKLDASALYTMGGLNAARMDNGQRICVFAQSDTAVYAVTCPVAHAEELANLLRYTTLVAPAAAN